MKTSSRNLDTPDNKSLVNKWKDYEKNRRTYFARVMIERRRLKQMDGKDSDKEDMMNASL